ncbi:MAG TPA: cell division protein FtsW [Candidatus Pullilachnospira intestinigallinarum]|nr:cell division protein FtsW [Candidatus Pullilachnospira intestinigallinarum]
MQKSAVKKKTKVRTGRRTADYYDYNLLAAVILLVCFGLVMLYSTSSYEAQLKFNGNDMYYFGRQAVISAGAIVLAVLVSRLDYHLLIPVAGLAYVGSLVLMAMVKYTPLGVSAYGARRWLNLGIQFQPSEIAKIAVIIYLPVVIIKMGRQFRTLKAVVVLLALGVLQAFAALFWTDNLSTGLIIGGIAVVVIFIAHPDTKWFVGIGSGAAALVCVVVAYMGMTMTTSDNFRIRRILSWLHPEENMSGGGYQVMQSLYAIGSGGFFGKGLGNSAQKLGTIPEAQNDMIFSIVCEELGVFGGVLLILMFLYLLYRLFFIAQNAPDLYGTLIVSGIFAHIALQVILNICVVINLMPTTGITLPFVSYGGTSILFLMMEIAIALSVSRKIRFKDAQE